MRTLWKFSLLSSTLSRIGELPPKSTGFVHGGIPPRLLVCDPTTGRILEMRKDKPLSLWMKRIDISSPLSVTLCNPNEIVIYSGGEDAMWWIQVSSQVCQRMAGRGAHMFLSSVPDKIAEGEDSCNRIAMADRKVYIAMRKTHRIVVLKENSSAEYAFGSGRKGFSIATSPLTNDIDSPASICFAKDQKALFVSEIGNRIVRKIDIPSLRTSGVFGIPMRAGHQDGHGSEAKFSSPGDLASDGNNVVVADGKALRMIRGNLVTTVYEAENVISGITFIGKDELIFATAL